MRSAPAAFSRVPHSAMCSLTPETQARLQSINKFLEDIYGHPRWLSDILRDAGGGEDEVTRLRRDHLDTYLAGLLQRWRSWMAEILPSRRDDIIFRRYSLNGSPRPSLANLGNEYDISRQRVRQLEKDALKRLRHPARRRRLEHISLEVAEDILKRPAEQCSTVERFALITPAARYGKGYRGRTEAGLEERS
jgi:hypothetical protein